MSEQNLLRDVIGRSETLFDRFFVNPNVVLVVFTDLEPDDVIFCMLLAKMLNKIQRDLEDSFGGASAPTIKTLPKAIIFVVGHGDVSLKHRRMEKYVELLFSTWMQRRIRVLGGSGTAMRVDGEGFDVLTTSEILSLRLEAFGGNSVENQHMTHFADTLCELTGPQGPQNELTVVSLKPMVELLDLWVKSPKLFIPGNVFQVTTLFAYMGFNERETEKLVTRDRMEMLSDLFGAFSFHFIYENRRAVNPEYFAIADVEWWPFEYHLPDWVLRCMDIWNHHTISKACNDKTRVLTEKITKARNNRQFVNADTGLLLWTLLPIEDALGFTTITPDGKRYVVEPDEKGKVVLGNTLIENFREMCS
jgi:hypothetical protein